MHLHTQSIAILRWVDANSFPKKLIISQERSWILLLRIAQMVNATWFCFISLKDTEELLCPHWYEICYWIGCEILEEVFRQWKRYNRHDNNNIREDHQVKSSTSFSHHPCPDDVISCIDSLTLFCFTLNHHRNNHIKSILSFFTAFWLSLFFAIHFLVDFSFSVVQLGCKNKSITHVGNHPPPPASSHSSSSHARAIVPTWHFAQLSCHNFSWKKGTIDALNLTFSCLLILSVLSLPCPLFLPCHFALILLCHTSLPILLVVAYHHDTSTPPSTFLSHYSHPHMLHSHFSSWNVVSIPHFMNVQIKMSQ